MRVDAPTLVIFAIISALACDQAPGASTVWTPVDHDKQEPSRGQQPAQPLSSAAQGTQLIEIAWMQNCAACHGVHGQGDGPKGATVKAPDLTDAEWQARVNDEEIEERIRKGKGLMPSFAMPESTLKGLVARIRAERGP